MAHVELNISARGREDFVDQLRRGLLEAGYGENAQINADLVATAVDAALEAIVRKLELIADPIEQLNLTPMAYDLLAQFAAARAEKAKVFAKTIGGVLDAEIGGKDDLDQLVSEALAPLLGKSAEEVLEDKRRFEGG